MWGVIQRLTYDVVMERGKQAASNLTDFGLWVDVLKSVDQRGIFGTQLFSQFVHFLWLLPFW